MKRLVSILLSILLFLLMTGCADEAVPGSEEPSSSTAPASSASSENTSDHSQTRVRLSFSGGQAVMLLNDSPTSQSLLKQLPQTVEVEDYAGAEKIAYFPEKLSTDGAPDGIDPEVGDVTCYGPWGNLAIFYQDQPYADGLIPMGRIESGLDALSKQSGKFKVKIEVLN